MARILIVEDEPDIALGLEGDLTAEGYTAEVVRDGVSACRRAREAAWDVILLDVMLPGKDGFEVCREIRRAGVKAHVIMLTAKTHEAEKVLGLEIGADDYVTKPFSPRELRARIKAAVRRGSVDAGEVFSFDDVEVDFARGEVRRSGAVVEMTPTEFKLVAAFVRHHGRVLTRDRLIEEAWGTGVFVTERAVDTHLVNLRRKLEAEPAVPRRFLSIRGQGYRFDA
jgi:DNA-binding response OmpR family regulator